MNGNAMIEVTNLTKRYAGRTAVADISFTVARGSRALTGGVRASG
jgi:ABC-type multidrug transport system ATPase subunit